MPATAKLAPKPAPAKAVAPKPALPRVAPASVGVAAHAAHAVAKASSLPAFVRAAIAGPARVPVAIKAAGPVGPVLVAKPMGTSHAAALGHNVGGVHPAAVDHSAAVHAVAAVKPVAVVKPNTVGLPVVKGKPVAAVKPHPPAAVKLPMLTRAGEHAPGGQPLAPHIQEAIERSFRVDFSHVRVHLTPLAQKNAAALSARAFTFGSNIFLGSGEHAGDLGLMAHEAAHVVQQQAGSSVQAWSGDRSDRYERDADRASSAVLRGDSYGVQERVSTPHVQRFGIRDALDFFADAAYNIPGYRMFTIVLGVNPINMQHADRSAANILRAMVEFMPGGALITQGLDKYSILDKAGAFVQEQIDTLGITGSSIKKALDTFLESLSWTDIVNAKGVWERAKHIFEEPIARIKSFAAGLVEGIWKFVREAVLKPLGELASKTDGWDLLCAVLQKNPITGEAVPRTAETLIGGFMKLIREDEVWANIKKANALPRAWAWFQGTLTELMGFVNALPALFLDTLHSLEWADILNLPGLFSKVAKPFGTFVGKFIGWAGDKVWNLLQLIFEVVAPAVMPYLKKVGASFKSILKNPMGFMHNLIAAGKLGFQNFASNITTHLKTGLIDWLTGSLPGVYIPKAISLPEVGKFSMSVLGISWAQIRAKIVKALGPNGEKIMAGLETTFDVVVALVKGGPAAAWELIKEKLTNLKDMVISGITSFVVTTIVQKAVPKIIAMFVPGAGFISAIVSIYDTVMVFVNKLAKIIAAVKAFLDSIMAIANGQIEGAAAKVESTLAGLLSLAISFLAGFLGLGNIASKVLAVIEKIRAVVDKALDTAINWIVDKAKKLWTSAKTVAKETAQSLLDWWRLKQPFKAADGSSHTLLFKGDDDTAELEFQSTPTQLVPYLISMKDLTVDQQGFIREITADVALINKIRTFKKKSPTAAEASDVKKNRDDVAAGLLRISQNLGKLMGGKDWGTADKPLPISYPKPAIGSYVSLYFGPKTKMPIPQVQLRDAASDPSKLITLVTKVKSGDPAAEKNWSTRGHKIEMFSPTTPTSLPDSGPRIGVSTAYAVNSGMKFKLSGDAASSPGGEVINGALRQYGYDRAIEHTDGDHVVEIQMGGINDLPNLWPLNSRMNQQAGSRLSKAQVPKPDGTTIKMSDLKREAKKREVWLVIVQTEG